MGKRSYTDERLIEVVKTSNSIMDVLKNLGLAKAGGSFTLCKAAIARLGLDTSHFVGKNWKKGLQLGPRKLLKEYLVDGSKLNYRVKSRLFSEGLFVRKCYKCSNTTWNGQPINLEVHHIDGNHFNNVITNLTMLCPNCHSQTESFKGRNWGRYD